MAVINDDRFIRQSLDNQDAGKVFNQRQYDKADLTGIANKDKWEAMRMVSDMIPKNKVAENDAFPSGTLVEFTAPDGTQYKGRVASKSGADYLVEVSDGESYLVPTGKLAKVTPESERIKEAMSRYVAPTIEVVSKPAIEMANRCVARIAYRDRKPTDDDLIRWAEQHYPDWRLVDAVDGDNREIGLIFEILAMEDDKPQGGDQLNRGRPLSGEMVEGTGMLACEDQLPGGLSDDIDECEYDTDSLDEGMKVEMEHTDNSEIAREIAKDHLTEDPQYYKKLRKIESNIISFDDINPTFTLENVVGSSKEAQLGEPGAEEDYRDLVRAARWVLARFNDSNPDYYAVPQESEEAGTAESRVVRLSFLLEKKNDEDELSHVYMSRGGQFVKEEDKQPGMHPVRGFVQVDSEGNMPVIMLNTPIGPMAIQQYDLNFTAEREIDKLADYDACRMLANDVLAEFGGYTSDAQAAFEARLVKLAIDDKAKDYWKGYFGDYGKMLTRDIKKRKQKAQKEEVPEDYADWAQFYFTQNHPFFGHEGPDEDDLPEGRKDVEDLEEEATESRFHTDIGGPDEPADAERWKKYLDVVKHIPKTRSANKKVAVDENAKQYWINYFGIAGVGWYGEALTRDIPRRIVGDDSPSPQESAPKRDSAPKKSKPPKKNTEQEETEETEEIEESEDIEKKASDYEGYIKETNGKYEVKSRKNPDWSGGTYDTRSEAEERLGQVEMFKHMSSADWKLRQDVGTALDCLLLGGQKNIRRIAADVESMFGKAQPHLRKQETPSGIPMRDLYNIATWTLEIAEQDEKMYDAVYSLVHDFLRKNPRFLRSQLKTNDLTPKAVGYVLTYALMKSPRTFNKFRKAVNKYMRRYERGEWDKLRDQTKEWRSQEKGKGKTQRGEGPQEMGSAAEDIAEELEVELEEGDLQEVEESQQEAAPKAKAPVKAPAKEAPKSEGTNVVKDIVQSFQSFREMDDKYQAGKADLKDTTSTLNKLLAVIDGNMDIYSKQIESKNPQLTDWLMSRVEFYQGESTKGQPAEPQKAAPQKATPPPPPQEEQVAQPQQPKKKTPLDLTKAQPSQQEEGNWLKPQMSSTIPQGYAMEYTSMRRRADAAPGPVTHNAPGKDDRKDYDHKEPREQPSKARTRFKITRIFSTTSSADNGYIFMELAWDPESFESMSDHNIQQQVISHVKGLESTKEFHDFGIMGRVRIIDFDKDAGVARIKVRCSETRGVPTLGYEGDLDSPVPLSGIR